MDFFIFGTFGIAVLIRIYLLYTETMTQLIYFRFYPVWITSYIGKKLSKCLSSVTLNKMSGNSCQKLVQPVLFWQNLYGKLCKIWEFRSLYLLFLGINNSILVFLYIMLLLILWIPLFLVAFYLVYFGTWTFILFVY